MSLDNPASTRTPTEVTGLKLHLKVTEAPDGTRSYEATYEFVYDDEDGRPIMESRRHGDALPHLSDTAKQAGKTMIDEALDTAQGTLS